MLNNKIWSIAVPAALFAVVAAVGVLSLPSPPPTKTITIGEVLKKWGYLEIRPAANQNGPGILSTLDTRGDDYVMLHPTCNMDRKEVSSKWDISDTTDSDLKNTLNARFKLGADLLASIGLSGGAVSDIEVKFENTKILTMTDESRRALESEYVKGACLDAIKAITVVDRLCVTQPFSAVQTDVNYHVTFTRNIAAEAKTKILGDISGVLSTGGRAENGDDIVGKGLFVGLKLSNSCIVFDEHTPDQPQKTVAMVPVSKAGIATNPTSAERSVD